MRCLPPAKLLAVLLAAALASPVHLVHAAPFYEGKSLAHPVVTSSQDSGADIAFIKEAGGVTAYYCACTGTNGEPLANAKARKLDTFGKADIRSVFYAALDRDPAPEHQTMLVLLRLDGKQGLRAYRYHHALGTYVRLAALQPALDRIAKADTALNAARVKAALAELAPLDYSVDGRVGGKSGNPDFDGVDHTTGTVMGYYTADGQRAAPDSKDAVTYKKIFGKKNGRFLTATYTLDSDMGSSLPNYRLWQLAWETAPQEFDGKPDGPSVFYSLAWDDNAVIERGNYVNGKRQGMWERSGLREGESKGAYVNGVAEGQWHYAGPRFSEDGVLRAGKREGRWTVINYNGDDDVTGFDTYAGGELNGPYERTTGSKVIERGEYVKGSRQGPWIIDDARGAFQDDLRSGPWTFFYRDGDVATTMRANFVKGKKHGEAIATTADGKLRLRDHYNMDVLDGARTRYAPDGAVIYSSTYRNGQLDGRERAYDDTGKILRLDTTWKMGKKDGLHARYYPNGKPERLAVIKGQLETWLRDYAENGQLINDIRRCSFNEYQWDRDDVCDYHRTYFANGKPEYDYVFQFGARQEGRSWYANGKVKDELLVDRVADRSVLNTYFESGQLKCTEPRIGHDKRTVNGVAMISYGTTNRDGDNICYHPNGKVASIFSFKNGKVLDCGKKFDETGKQTSPGPEGCPPPKKPHFIFGE